MVDVRHSSSPVSGSCPVTKQVCSFVALAAVDAGNEDAVGDDRAGVPAEAQRVVGLHRLPRFLSGPRVERYEVGVGGGEKQLVAVERQRAGGAGPRVLRQPVAVHPDHVAGRRVERLDDVPRTGEEHHPLVHQRRRLVVALADRDRPGEVQLADVVARYLIERAVTVAVARAAPAQPVARRRVREQRVRHRAQIVRHHLVDEPRRPAAGPLARPRRAPGLLDVRGIADRHPRIGQQGTVARHRAVRLEHVCHQAHVGSIAERAGLPRRHLVAQIGEQLVGGPPRPAVQEVHADEGRRVDHALQARAVTLFALHPIDRPAVGRLVPGEGPVRRRALRRRDTRRDARSASHDHDDSGRQRPDHRSREIPPMPTRSAHADARSLGHDPLLLEPPQRQRLPVRPRGDTTRSLTAGIPAPRFTRF